MGCGNVLSSRKLFFLMKILVVKSKNYNSSMIFFQSDSLFDECGGDDVFQINQGQYRTEQQTIKKKLDLTSVMSFDDSGDSSEF